MKINIANRSSAKLCMGIYMLFVTEAMDLETLNESSIMNIGIRAKKNAVQFINEALKHYQSMKSVPKALTATVRPIHFAKTRMWLIRVTKINGNTLLGDMEWPVEPVN